MARFFSSAMVILVLVLASSAICDQKQLVDLKKDQRLKRTLRLDDEILTLGAVAKNIGKATGTAIYVQGELLRRPVTLAANGRTCAEVMTDLANLFGGVWIERDKAYLLVTDEVRLGLVATAKRPRSSGNELVSIAQSILPGQWSPLRVKNRLRFEQLTPQQQRMYQVYLAEQYYKSPQSYSSSMLIGTDVVIGLRPDADGWALTFVVPKITDDARFEPAELAFIPITVPPDNTGG